MGGKHENMKFQLLIGLVILCLSMIVGMCRAQQCVIHLKDGSKVATVINASSSSSLFTNHGSYQLSKLSEVVFKAKDDKYAGVYRNIEQGGVDCKFDEDISVPIADLLADKELFKSKNERYVDHLPVTEDEQIIYEEVVQVEGISADVLYSRAQLFFTNTFKSAKDVVQMADASSHIITGKALTSVQVFTGMGYQENNLYYSLKIECRDGRFKYSVYDMYFEYPAPYEATKTVATGDFRKRNYYKDNGKAKQRPESYAKAMNDEVLLLRGYIIEQLQFKSETVDDDW